jgi:WD40 repeat protein
LTSFTELYTISSGAILPSYTHSSIPYKTNTNNNVSLSAIDSINTNHSSHDYPVPVFALSHRILAYASPPPRADSDIGAISQPRTHHRSPSSTLGISHATALKVGGTVLSGVKSLGGMAYSAAAEYAKSRAGAGGDQSRVTAQGQSSVMSGVSNLFFSRSAPAASGHVEDSGSAMRASSAPFQDRQGQEETDPPALSSGYHITVLDLASLLARDDPSACARIISEFIAFKHQPISALKFTQDGNSLVVSPRDGQVVRIFQIRPIPRVSISGRENALVGRPDPLHMYSLRRGRTSAIVDEIEVSPDGRWVAVGTRKPTVHIFAINPYGGKPDLRSHMENKVRNADEAVSNY